MQHTELLTEWTNADCHYAAGKENLEALVFRSHQKILV